MLLKGTAVLITALVLLFSSANAKAEDQTEELKAQAVRQCSLIVSKGQSEVTPEPNTPSKKRVDLCVAMKLSKSKKCTDDYAESMKSLGKVKTKKDFIKLYKNIGQLTACDNLIDVQLVENFFPEK